MANFFIKFEKNVPFTALDAKGAPSIHEPYPETYFNWRLSPILAQMRFVHEIARGLREYGYPKSDITKGYRAEFWMNLYDFWWLFKYYREKSYQGFVLAGLLFAVALVSVLRLWRLVK